MSLDINQTGPLTLIAYSFIHFYLTFWIYHVHVACTSLLVRKNALVLGFRVHA